MPHDQHLFEEAEDVGCQLGPQAVRVVLKSLARRMHPSPKVVAGFWLSASCSCVLHVTC